MRISLRPLGEVGPSSLEELSRGLTGVFGCPVEIASGVKNIDKAYHDRRCQYQAPALLYMIRETGIAPGEIALGIADVDLFAPDLNFVFGQAYAGGRSAVISLARLRQEFYGLPADHALFIERTLKEAVHEIGHLVGLGHCLSPNCVMYFSNSLADTDVKTASFCAKCRPRMAI